MTMFHYALDARMLLVYAFAFVVSFGLFSLLSQLYPNVRGQKLLRTGIRVDAIYWFLIPVIYVQISQWALVAISFVFFVNVLEARQFTQHGLELFVHIPLVIQFFISILLMNLVEYGSHRVFHGRTLWKFHAIHHAPEELDWLSGVRLHPVNMLAHSILAGTLVFALGFSPIIYVLRFPFDVFYAGMVHANLNWTFGPLRYIFASPVFHRFHHTSPKDGGERNFAPNFSFIDVIFGTFYMPEGRIPETFGVIEKVPETFWGQLAYPFRKNISN